MRTRGSVGAALLVSALCTATGYASDPVGVYARVDKVVLEPNTDAPQTIQVWGVFALAKPGDPNEYLPPARGYLYFTLPSDSRAARAEWADLSRVAGAGQIVSFGSRYELKARLRPADQRPSSPDAYSLNFGLTTVRGRTDYAPIRALIAFKD
jgi:hypothetical protein